MILWLLNSWISYIVHAALIAGVIGTFFGSIVARIPVINSYGAIVKTIALPLLIVAIFAEGYLFASKSWIEETKKFEEKVKILKYYFKYLLQVSFYIYSQKPALASLVPQFYYL